MRQAARLLTILLLPGAAWAQGGAPGATPPPAPPGAGAPATSNSPAAVPPSAAPGPAAQAVKTLAIRAPSGSQYTAWVQEGTGAPKNFSDKTDLEIPAGATKLTVYVLDTKTGYAARRSVDAKSAPVEMSFAGPDFKLVQRIEVTVTGKDDKPIAGGAVTLTDSAKNTRRELLTAGSMGMAAFDFVASGPGSITVTPEGGSATTKDVTLDLSRGQTVQTIPISLPEVTATLEPAPGTTPAPDANAPAPAASAPPVAAPQPLPQPTGGGSIGGTVISFIFLVLLVGGAYLYMKNKGITVEHVIKKLGVQPDTVAAGGGSLAGANLAGGTASPGAPPPPPPIVSDPNQCPYCGQMKDPSGNCACSVAPGSASYATGPAFGATPMAGSGPRLVGMAGTYMGQVFPIAGSAVIGREATNTVPLDQDTTASRRHAQITDAGGVFQIQDLGSSNGTFVNGAKVSDSVLQSGDEVSIGGTRFRFEV